MYKKGNYVAVLGQMKSAIKSTNRQRLTVSRHTITITEEVTKSGSLLPLEKNSLLSKIGDQRCDRKCYQ